MATPTPLRFREYEVTVTPKTPACGETAAVLSIHAGSSNDAIKQARTTVSNAGRTRQDGALIYRARLKR